MTERRDLPTDDRTTSTVDSPTGRRARRAAVLLRSLLLAAHLGPSLAVTAMTGLLAVTFGLPWDRATLVTLAVLSGQLTIGWGNDLLDQERDRSVGRADKPLATGQVPPAMARGALAAAAVICVALSLSVGWRSGTLHLLVAVTAAHLYNLGLKATVWSWAPYAVAFGVLPAVVSLADAPPQWPPVWIGGAAAGLGIAAHLLNVLRDLDDDAATGVHGLPHRLGARWSRWIAAAILLATTAVLVLGPAEVPVGWAGLTLSVVTALTAVTLLGRGRAPFAAAVLVALCNVVLLAAAAG